MELFEQRDLLPFHIAELLLLDLKFPLNLEILLFALLDLFINHNELVFDFFVFLGINFQFFAPSNGCIVGTLFGSIFISFVPQLSPEAIVVLPCISQVVLQLPDYVQVSVGNFSVVSLDGFVLLRVFGGQFMNSGIFLVLNHQNCVFTALLHVRPQQEHLVLEVQLYFVGDSLKFFAFFGHLGVVVFRHRIEELLLPHSLLLFLHLECADVLFQFPFLHAVLIFVVFEGALSFFLELGQLVEVVEDQVL